ncbi:hypothetical protein [Methanoculleus taiwanensis]|nr:hypothetical protein [Methanoculleus taiwanensis]
MTRQGYTVLGICILLICTAAGCLGQQESVSVVPDNGTDCDMLRLLDEMQGGIEAALAGLDARVAGTAENLTATGLAGDEARALLAENLAADPLIATAITIDRNGTVAAAVPESLAAELVGENLSHQEVVRETFERQAPVMTDRAPLAEGGYAVILQHPVFAADGSLIGATSITFDPYLLLKAEIEPVLNGTPYTAMVAETDGTILYDADPAEITKETFNESLYAEFPEVIAFAREYAQNQSGNATYSFYDTGFNRVVQKEAFWTTVGLHGTEWRLIIIREMGEA